MCHLHGVAVVLTDCFLAAETNLQPSSSLMQLLVKSLPLEPCLVQISKDMTCSPAGFTSFSITLMFQPVRSDVSYFTTL